jgi:hypothetical protein
MTGLFDKLKNNLFGSAIARIFPVELMPLKKCYVITQLHYVYRYRGAKASLPSTGPGGIHEALFATGRS